MPTYVRCYAKGTLRVQREDLKRVYTKLVKGHQGIPESSFWDDFDEDLSNLDEVVTIENPSLSGTFRDIEGFEEFLSVTKGSVQVEFQFEGEPSTFTDYVDGKMVKTPTIKELNTRVQNLERQHKISQEAFRSLDEKIKELESQMAVIVHMKGRV
jgi:hypothetical protein